MHGKGKSPPPFCPKKRMMLLRCELSLLPVNKIRGIILKQLYHVFHSTACFHLEVILQRRSFLIMLMRFFNILVSLYQIVHFNTSRLYILV